VRRFRRILAAPRIRSGSRLVIDGAPARRLAAGCALVALLAGGCGRRNARIETSAPFPATREAAGDGDVTSAPRSGPALEAYNRGVAAFDRGRLAEAETAFTSALAVAPDFGAARYNLALVWLKRGLYDRAEPQLRALAAASPRDADLLFAHGNCLFHQARFADAAAVFRRLVGVVPGHREGAYSLARSLQETGRRTEAIAAWEAYLRLDTTSGWADKARRALRELRGE